MKFIALVMLGFLSVPLGFLPALFILFVASAFFYSTEKSPYSKR